MPLDINTLPTLFVGTQKFTVGTAPVGLLLLGNGTIICKSEYRNLQQCECTIVASGENYCGGYSVQCVSLQILK